MRIAGIVIFILLSLSVVILVQAQTFEVASIKLANAGTFNPPNFALDYLDSFGGAAPHGRLVAQFPLQVYIGFAYKLFPYSQEQKDAMLAHVPKWVSTDPYMINAQADGNSSKDQMRLMLKSLLADRFKLAAHFERLETPVLALVLDKPGKTGAKLHPHADGLPCDAAPSDVFPPVCDAIMATNKPNNSVVLGARNLTMEQIAAALISTGRVTRPVVDQTGLSGRFDFTVEWIKEANNPGPADLQEGTVFQEALQDQLGLKLKSTKVFMDTLVINHVERPSEN